MIRAEYEARKQSLLAEIERAFESITREGGVPFSLTEFSKGLTLEAQEEMAMLKVDTEARWQDLPDQLIDEYGHFILSFADAQSFRYYLPAFLTRYLHGVDSNDEGFHSEYLTLEALTVDLRLKPNMVAYQREKFALIAPDQAKVIAKFLIFRAERLIFQDEQGEFHDATSDYNFLDYDGEYRSCKRALENHWGQFWDGELPPLSERQLTIKVPKKLPDPQKLAAYEARKQQLIEEIERVFDGVEREDGVTLHEADVIDVYGSESERDKARLLDSETRWQDVPAEDIRWGSSNLSFMDEKGFHYYFPAYLVWYLRFMDSEEEGFSSNTFESIDYKLLTPRHAEVDDSFLERFSLFSVEEKRTIAHFLQFQEERQDFLDEQEDLDNTTNEENSQAQELRERLIAINEQFGDSAQGALDKYWGQFLEK